MYYLLMNMNKNPFETAGEHESKEELEQQLEVAKQERDAVREQASDFYDEEDALFYTKVVSPMAKEIQPVYIRSVGKDAAALTDNYKKYELFRTEKLKPAEEKVREAELKLWKIKNEEGIAQTNKKMEEDAARFQEEKQVLEDRLYVALDAIHAQLPDEARDSGMNTYAAIVKYLPRSIEQAASIEHYIGEIQKIKEPYELAWLKKDMQMHNFSLE
jgi:hypothetical protein